MMRRFLHLLLLFSLAPPALPEGRLAGAWHGEIDVGAALARLEVILEYTGDGALAGEISFPDDGEFGIALSNVVAEGHRVSFGLPEVPGEPKFAGELIEDGSTIRGTFEQGGRRFPFELRRGPAPDVEASVDAGARSEVVEAIAERLIEGYVYEDEGRRIAARLRDLAAAGRYDERTVPARFALALTEDLRSIGDDIHLRVEHPRSRPDDEGPAAAADSGVDREPRPHSHSGLGRHEILDGEVGYLEMLHFGGGEAAAPELDRALAALSGVRALILDLRRNLGGGPFMVRYLSTYLFDEPTHLASRVERGAPEPAERWTFESVPGERLAKVPVVVLTSRTTVSAGESFAFGLRNTGRATIVGERTAGGGHFGDMVDVGHGFRMFLPRGKTVHPVTGEGWEAEGLEPDVEAPAAVALERALELLRAAGG